MSADQADERRKLLRIYVSDHLAGSAAGTRRIARLADAERGQPDGERIRLVADEIKADQVALQVLADRLELHPQRSKQVLAAVGERVGLLKLNGRIFRRSPLTTVVELEGLLMAVRGKLAGWQTLRALPDVASTPDLDLDELVARTSRQLETLESVHARAVERVLGVPPAGRTD